MNYYVFILRSLTVLREMTILTEHVVIGSKR